MILPHVTASFCICDTRVKNPALAGEFQRAGGGGGGGGGLCDFARVFVRSPSPNRATRKQLFKETPALSSRRAPVGGRASKGGKQSASARKKLPLHRENMRLRSPALIKKRNNHLLFIYSHQAESLSLVLHKNISHVKACWYFTVMAGA